jgi:hypothetical protein
MSWRLPGPVAGSCAQPAPNGRWSATAAVVGAGEVEPAELAADRDALPGVQAARGTVRPTAIAAYQLRFTYCCSFGGAAQVATTVTECHPVAPAG